MAVFKAKAEAEAKAKCLGQGDHFESLRSGQDPTFLAHVHDVGSTCLQVSANDVSYFDADFTMEKPQLTPPDDSLLMTVDQQLFNGFSYTNHDPVKMNV